jgi:hypothetical protein
MLTIDERVHLSRGVATCRRAIGRAGRETGAARRIQSLLAEKYRAELVMILGVSAAEFALRRGGLR